jgi:hypothetical protein
VRGGSEKNGLLPVGLLKPQIGGQQVAVGDLPLLDQILNLLAHFGFVSRRLDGSRLEKNGDPVRLGQPAETRPRFGVARLQGKKNFLLATLESRQNPLAVDAQQVLKQVQIGFGIEPLGQQRLLSVKIREQNGPATVRDQQGTVEGVQKTGDKLKTGLPASLLLLLGHRFRQFHPPGPAREKTPLSSSKPKRGWWVG